MREERGSDTKPRCCKTTKGFLSSRLCPQIKDSCKLNTELKLLRSLPTSYTHNARCEGGVPPAGGARSCRAGGEGAIPKWTIPSPSPVQKMYCSLRPLSLKTRRPKNLHACNTNFKLLGHT